MNMIEKIARAIMESYQGSDAGMYAKGHGKYAEDGMFREDAMGAARAVLTTLLQPTEEMVEAGESQILQDPENVVDYKDVYAAFQEMIRRALQDA